MRDISFTFNDSVYNSDMDIIFYNNEDVTKYKYKCIFKCNSREWLSDIYELYSSKGR